MADISVAEWIILGVLALVVILLVSTRIALSSMEMRLRRLQKALDDNPIRASEADGSSSTESAFDQFLAEDPERLKLSKTEQFAAYREWRKVKGMNWSS